MAERSILVVDDEPIILLALRLSLATALGPGYRVETAPSGAAALALMDELDADGPPLAGVVSDWRMPHMSGDRFLREARQRYPDLPLVLLTGYADRDLAEALHRELGLAASLEKPCDTAALVRALLG
ncbi:MAG TPA: response regulator [Spirochaetales bacterium]|nr:response regulator [Spirochaetales bacterium]